MSKEKSAFLKRCEDCAECTKDLKCNECFGQPISEIDDCPLGLTLEIVQKSQDIKVKIDHGARKSAENKKKSHKIVVSDEKQQLFLDILTNLQSIYGENVQILKENKLISVKINEKVFKIDVIQTRNKKN